YGDWSSDVCSSDLTLSRPGLVQRAAVPVAGTPAGGGQFGNGVVWTHGHGRAGDARVCGAQRGDENQTGDVGEGATDGATSAFRATDFRAFSQARRDARPGRRGAIPPGGRHHARRRGAPFAAAARPVAFT